MLGHPKHRASCQSRTRPIRCQDCNDKVFAYECSCGSFVLLEAPLGPPWTEHDCYERDLAKIRREETKKYSGSVLIKRSEYQDRVRQMKTKFNHHGRSTFLSKRKLRQQGESKKRRRTNYAEPSRSNILPHGFVQRDIIGFVKAIDLGASSLARVRNRDIKKSKLPPNKEMAQLTVIDGTKNPNQRFVCLVLKRQIAELVQGATIGLSIKGSNDGGELFWFVKSLKALDTI